MRDRQRQPAVFTLFSWQSLASVFATGFFLNDKDKGASRKHETGQGHFWSPPPPLVLQRNFVESVTNIAKNMRMFLSASLKA